MDLIDQFTFTFK